MKTNLWGVVVGVAIAIAATTASACTRDYPAGANQMVPARVDQQLLDAVVRAEVNYERCRAGLRPLGAARSALVEVAEAHSRWMARSGQLSHRSGVPGASSLTERIRSANVEARKGAENIGMVHRYRIDGQHFRIVDSASCSFATRSGEALPAHSYASLARHAVGLWMNSSGHRRNILDPGVTRVSTAAAFGDGQYCGQFWLTQNFVG
ncbi:MAG: CAP domain-containing protein [Rhodobacteraceae bacterium]|jgi:uncharacterized protein YkwD|nr:CAP domain-containing protein [Paracoccaceae bacterium]